MLLSAYARNTLFTPASAQYAKAALVQLLSTRLKSQARLAAPGPRVRLKKPWIILSMPRSGTTALHRMLCADPCAQGLEHWLGLYPQPRPPKAQWANLEDFAATDQSLKATRQAAPTLFEMHEMAAAAVDECGLLLNQSFANMGFFQTANIPDYEAWLWTYDMKQAFARHRAALELIDNGEGRRWVLKDPSHLVTLDGLRHEYPDLRVICIRRPAAEFLPSVSALVHSARVLKEPSIDKTSVGRHQMQCWARCAHALVDWRAQNPGIPWCDVDLDSLRENPIDTIGRIYAQFDEEYSSEARAAIRAELITLKAGQSRNRPTYEEYGISPVDVAASFPKEFL